MKASFVFSVGAFLFYVLVALVVFMLARLMNSLAEFRKNTPPRLDLAQIERVSAELSSLSRFELFAVRHLCSVEGMTGEQFYVVVKQLGFPVLTMQQQNEIIGTFDRIASKTPLVSRGDGANLHWSIRADVRSYVQAVIDNQRPIFGF